MSMSNDTKMTKPSPNSKKKRKWGDRKDGRRVKAPGLQTVMAYLMPKRTDCEVYLHDTFDITDLLTFVEEKNRLHPAYRTTLFHCILAALARMVRERPKMNRFIQGYRLYERNEISLSFVVKRRFEDHAEESLMVLVPEETDTVDDLSRKIDAEVHEIRKSEHATGGIDSLLDAFARIPRPILAVVIRIIRILDFWGVNPDFLTEGDPNYTTILCSNLGSIKCPAVYHHLNNYGTNSIMVTIGAWKKQPVLMSDGSTQIRTVVDIGVTLDERIADGFYFARSLRLIHHICANPQILDLPLSKASGYTYD